MLIRNSWFDLIVHMYLLVGSWFECHVGHFGVLFLPLPHKHMASRKRNKCSVIFRKDASLTELGPHVRSFCVTLA